MVVPEVLIDDLTALGDALDNPSADLTETFRALAEHLAESIPAFLSVTLMVLTQDRPVVLSRTTLRDQRVRGSLLLSLSPRAFRPPAAPSPSRAPHPAPSPTSLTTPDGSSTLTVRQLWTVDTCPRTRRRRAAISPPRILMTLIAPQSQVATAQTLCPALRVGRHLTHAPGFTRFVFGPPTGDEYKVRYRLHLWVAPLDGSALELQRPARDLDIRLPASLPRQTPTLPLHVHPLD
jgi:hypothetical protein